MVASRPLIAGCLVVALVPCVPASAQELAPDEIVDGAADRIAEHRMGDATLKVIDANGEPVEGAEVEIRQVQHAFLFGCNIFGWGQPNEEDAAKYRDQFAALLNYATLPFYWGSFERERGNPRYDQNDAIAGWCREHAIVTKGHPLVWNMVPPGWLTEEMSLDDIKEWSDTRVREIIEHYGGLIDIWDVVNEATDPFRFQNPVTEMWRYVGQVQLVLDSFKVAREANPEATLLINDYRVGEDYAKVVEQLVDGAGKPLYDVIGIQSHMHGGAWSPERVWEVCERFARFGVPLHFTETTVVSGPREGDRWGETDAELEERQAEQVAQFYTLVFSHPATEALTWWDFSDRGAWQGAAAGFLRKDLSPKPVYDKLMSLIKGEWWTEIDAETGEDGTHEFRGFHGGYHIEVTGPEGWKGAADVWLGRDAENAYTIEVR